MSRIWEGKGTELGKEDRAGFGMGFGRRGGSGVWDLACGGVDVWDWVGVWGCPLYILRAALGVHFESFFASVLWASLLLRGVRDHSCCSNYFPAVFQYCALIESFID